jgi:nucleoid-associated protein YgaU
VDPAPARTPALTATRSGEEYVVAKGDTLIGILQKKYGRASEQVMAAFKAANADVKDRHMIREGQKLILPDLGPDFEPVAARSIDLSKPTARTASSDLEKMLDNKTTRKAPEPRETDSKPKSELATILKKPEKKAEPEYRIYEVQPRDNFSTIARDQLGSETLWREIAKLNKNIDPARMLPGTKIKLPAKRPLADTVAESARPRS